MNNESTVCVGSSPITSFPGRTIKEECLNSKPLSPKQIAIRQKKGISKSRCATGSHQSINSVNKYDRKISGRKLSILKQEFERACRHWRASQVEVEEIEAEATAIYKKCQSELALLHQERDAARLIRQDKLNKLIEIQAEVNKLQHSSPVV